MHISSLPAVPIAALLVLATMYVAVHAIVLVPVLGASISFEGAAVTVFALQSELIVIAVWLLWAPIRIGRRIAVGAVWTTVVWLTAVKLAGRLPLIHEGRSSLVFATAWLATGTLVGVVVLVAWRRLYVPQERFVFPFLSNDARDAATATVSGIRPSQFSMAEMLAATGSCALLVTIGKMSLPVVAQGGQGVGRQELQTVLTMLAFTAALMPPLALATLRPRKRAWWLLVYVPLLLGIETAILSLEMAASSTPPELDAWTIAWDMGITTLVRTAPVVVAFLLLRIAGLRLTPP